MRTLKRVVFVALVGQIITYWNDQKRVYPLLTKLLKQHLPNNINSVQFDVGDITFTFGLKYTESSQGTFCLMNARLNTLIGRPPERTFRYYLPSETHPRGGISWPAYTKVEWF